MESTELEEQIAPLASLADPTRRRLYLFAVARPQGVGRDEAATGVGISRALAAFHLDRLVADSLLVADYRRLSGRTGPGAGRPAKIYRRSARELSFSMPRRNYELLARLLVQALTSTGEAPPESLSRGAHDVGVSMGCEARDRAGRSAGRDRLLDAAATVLDDCGFEPRRGEDGCLVLGNCPFSPLSGQYNDLICHTNLALMQGVVSGLRAKGVEAVLEREPDRCCVTFRRVQERAAAGTQ